MSLVYTTLLSLVPLLALTFSVLKGFGVHNQMEPMLLNLLAPLGDKGVEIATNVVGFVENIKVGVLGALGLGMLVYTVISLLHKIEQSFNYTWHIKESRPIGQRFSEYLSVVLVGPLLIFSAIGLTASMMSSSLVQGMAAIPVLGIIVSVAGSLIPYLFVIAAFTFVYIFIPNTKVHFFAALVGGIVSGFLWETVGLIFGSFAAGATNYTAVYSGFAILILFMIWLFISWLILLLGASIAFYTQHPQHLGLERGEVTLSSQTFEKIALLTMFYIGNHYYRQKKDWKLDDLTDWLGTPQDVTETVLKRLHDSGLIIHTSEETLVYVPSTDMENVSIKQLLDTVRASGESGSFDSSQLPSELAVEQLLTDVDQSVAKGLQQRTLKDVVLSASE